jgi:Tfp pilus assembly protein PilN
VRPVNLIPPEDRRGDQAPLRAGPLAYILLGGLVLALVGVVVLVLTGNQISERRDELATLKHEDAVAAAKAARLSSYSQFQGLAEARAQTVRSLADSRFDWERVMRELALILPSDVWLVNLAATATPDVSLEGAGGGESSLRGSIKGPALELSGCATGQTAVARFVTSLRDIDGVTRVGVESSELPGKKGGAGSSTGSGGDSGNDDCRTRSFIAKFEIVVAFDAAPLPPSEGEGEAPPEAEPEAAQAASSETSQSSSESSGESGGGSEGG